MFDGFQFKLKKKEKKSLHRKDLNLISFQF